MSNTTRFDNRPNLVTTWTRLVYDEGYTLVEAIHKLDKATGLSVTHSRIREWEKGLRKPPAEVINYMMAAILPGLLREFQDGTLTQREIKEALQIPSKPEESQ